MSRAGGNESGPDSGSTGTMRNVRWVGAAGAALVLSACISVPPVPPRTAEPRPASAAPPEPAAAPAADRHADAFDAEWAKLTAELDREGLTSASAGNHKYRVWTFRSRLPKGHPLHAVVAARAEAIDRVIADYDARLFGRITAASKAFASGDPRPMAEAVVFMMQTSFDEPSAGAAPPPVSLRLGDAAVVAQPVSVVAYVLLDAMDDLLAGRDRGPTGVGPLDPTGLGSWPRRDALSTLLATALGRRLYVSEARVDKKALASLLTALWTAPDAPFLGVPAREVYAGSRELVRDAARVYAALRDGPGKAAALKEYKAALARHVAPMQSFYRSFAEAHGLAAAAAPVNAGDLTYYTGFWLRRMADGTDADLYKFVTKVLAAYDPEFTIAPAR